MKSVTQIVVAFAIAAPAIALAQAGATVTRAQVKAGIVQLEKDGYSPAGSDIDYPSSMLAAEARAQHDVSVNAYGGRGSGSTSEAGSRTAHVDANSSGRQNDDALYIGD